MAAAYLPCGRRDRAGVPGGISGGGLALERGSARRDSAVASVQHCDLAAVPADHVFAGLPAAHGAGDPGELRADVLEQCGAGDNRAEFRSADVYADDNDGGRGGDGALELALAGRTGDSECGRAGGVYSDGWVGQRTPGE